MPRPIQAAVDVLGCPSRWAETADPFLNGRLWHKASLRRVFRSCKVKGFLPVVMASNGRAAVMAVARVNGHSRVMIAALGSK